MSDRVHRAVKDGRLDILKAAFKQQLNERDDSGMTPTLWAAHSGNLEALTVCCKRGGDSNKCDYLGNCALHLAAQNGHIHAVMFLVKFGCNIWQLDNDYNTALATAGIRDQTQIVNYLDDVMNKERAKSSSKIKDIEAKEKKKAVERIKKYDKLQLRQQRTLEQFHNGGDPRRKISMMGRPETKVTKQRRFSEIVMQTSRLQSQAAHPKQHRESKSNLFRTLGNNFRNKQTLATELNKQQPGTINGIPSEQVSSVIYQQSDTILAQANNSSPGRRRVPLQGVFPETEQSDDKLPVFGTMALRQNFKATSAMYSALQEIDQQDDEGESIKPSAVRPNVPVDEDYSSDEDSNSKEDISPIETFLSSLNLLEYLPVLEEHHLDMDALELCTHEELKEAGLSLGPRVKIMNGLKANKEKIDFETDDTLF